MEEKKLLETGDTLRIALRNSARDEAEVYWYKVGSIGKSWFTLTPDDEHNEVTVEVSVHGPSSSAGRPSPTAPE